MLKAFVEALDHEYLPLSDGVVGEGKDANINADGIDAAASI